MLEFVRTWLTGRPERIGIDFGTQTLRMAQVDEDENDFQLRTAASAPIPIEIANNIPARMEFFTKTVRDLLVQGRFRGKSAVIGLPSAWVSACQLQFARSTESEISKLLPKAAAEQITIHDSLLRHIVAGECLGNGTNQIEVIATSAKSSYVNALLAAAERAGLDVVGIVLEPSAIVDCFTHVYRRKADANATTCFVDLGSVGTRMIISRGKRIMHLRCIATGGDDFTAAVAEEFNVDFGDARLLRQKQTHATTVRSDGDTAIDVSDESHPPDADDTDARMEAVLERPINALIAELRAGRSNHELKFPSLPIERLVFTGGEARNKFICQRIARALDLPAQLGDPMVRMSRSKGSGLLGGIDRRQPQPEWAVALGLAMGPTSTPTELPEFLANAKRAVWSGKRTSRPRKRVAA